MNGRGRSDHTLEQFFSHSINSIVPLLGCCLIKRSGCHLNQQSASVLTFLFSVTRLTSFSRSHPAFSARIHIRRHVHSRAIHSMLCFYIIYTYILLCSVSCARCLHNTNWRGCSCCSGRPNKDHLTPTGTDHFWSIPTDTQPWVTLFLQFMIPLHLMIPVTLPFQTSNSYCAPVCAPTGQVQERRTTSWSKTGGFSPRGARSPVICHHIGRMVI